MLFFLKVLTIEYISKLFLVMPCLFSLLNSTPNFYTTLVSFTQALNLEEFILYNQFCGVSASLHP